MLPMFARYVEEHKEELDEILLEVYREIHSKDFEERIIEKHKDDIKEEKSIEIAKNFNDICSDEEISKCTGLHIEKVREL